MKGVKFSTTNVKFLEQTDSIKNFSSILRKNKPLTLDEERVLFDEYQNHGNLKARDEIIMRNQRFVFSIAKRYCTDTDNIFDYVSEGNIGLIKAIDDFDPNLGFKFSTFMVNYIRREMYQFMIDQKYMVKKTNLLKYGSLISDVVEKFISKNGRKPDIYEIKEEMELRGEKVNDINSLFDVDIQSLDDEVDDDYRFEDTEIFNEKTSVCNEYELNIEETFTDNVVNKLLLLINDKEREIIKKLYSIGYDYSYSIDMLSEEYHVPVDYMEKIVNNILLYLKQESSVCKKC